MGIFEGSRADTDGAVIILTSEGDPSNSFDGKAIPTGVQDFQRLQYVWFRCADMVRFHIRCFRRLCQFYTDEGAAESVLRYALIEYEKALQLLTNMCWDRHGAKYDIAFFLQEQILESHNLDGRSGIIQILILLVVRVCEFCFRAPVQEFVFNLCCLLSLCSCAFDAKAKSICARGDNIEAFGVTLGDIYGPRRRLRRKSHPSLYGC